MTYTLRNKNGFSLIEVLIFVTVFSIFFILAAAVVTTSLRITKENQNKIRAAHYAEELKEWFEAEKEINWGGARCRSCVISNDSGFTEIVTQQTSDANPTAPTSFCFNNAVLSDWPSPGADGCRMVLDGQYRRIATFSATIVDNYVNQINISIAVDWKEGGKTVAVPMLTTFSIWE